MSHKMSAKIKLFAFLFAVACLFSSAGCGGGGKGNGAVNPNGDDIHRSPDGRYIAYIRYDRTVTPNVGSIRLKNADGTNDRVIESTTGTWTGLVWSQNSRAIAYLEYKKAVRGVRADETAPRTLYTHSDPFHPLSWVHGIGEWKSNGDLVLNIADDGSTSASRTQVVNIPQ